MIHESVWPAHASRPSGLARGTVTRVLPELETVSAGNDRTSGQSGPRAAGRLDADREGREIPQRLIGGGNELDGALVVCRQHADRFGRLVLPAGQAPELVAMPGRRRLECELFHPQFVRVPGGKG